MFIASVKAIIVSPNSCKFSNYWFYINFFAIIIYFTTTSSTTTTEAFDIITTTRKFATLSRLTNNNILPTLFMTSTSQQEQASSSSSSSSSSSLNDMKFGRFVISSSHIFYKSSTHNTAAFVNLRPIVPGHVLVMPERIVPTMAELTNEEYLDLWSTVRIVQRTLSKHYKDATAFNVAVQDGKAAGQSVPHVHVHILPRKSNDFERNDDVYQELEDWVPRPNNNNNNNSNSKDVAPKQQLHVPDDKDRKDRTYEMMAEEASIYKALMTSSDDGDDDGTSKL